MRRLAPVLELIGTLTRSRLRLWQLRPDQDGDGMELASGEDPGWRPPAATVEGPVETPDGPRWFTPVPEGDGLWLEVEGDPARLTATPRAALAAPLIERILSSERDASRLWDELTVRYAEIDLLYAISEILGQTVRLEEAARTIIRQVSRVVGARRASIMVHDDPAGVLRVVAAQGFDPAQAEPVPVDDPQSVAARVFREQRVLAGGGGAGGDGAASNRPGSRRPGYKGRAWLSVPIAYAAPGAPARPIGVINLTDALSGDRFSPRDRKLVTAVASQIGAAIENARLAAREREQQRLEDELDLAHQLQRRLMPEPAALQGAARVGVRCLQVASVGGDFYTFHRLRKGQVGVMLGDVSSHGMSAALVMALVLAAAGIHTAGEDDPAVTLQLLRESLVARLSETEMFVSLFYAVLDRDRRTLCYASAGHPHAFRLRAGEAPARLEATAPPLGLGAGAPIGRQDIGWDPERDLLVLFTDGMVDAVGEDGGRYGEPRLLERLMALGDREPDAIVAELMEEIERFAPSPEDDRTLLVLRA